MGAVFAVNVAINLPVKSLFRQFTYAVPAKLHFLDVGWRVVVPFSGQKVEGFVVERCAMPTEPQILAKIKYVEAALGDSPWFDKEMLATAKWLAAYYMCSLAEAMRLFVPGKTSIRRQAVRDAAGRLLYYSYGERLKEKTVQAYALNEAGREALEGGLLAKKARAQHGALAVLADAEEWLSVAELAAKGISRAVMKGLLERGFVEQREKRVLRNSYARPAGLAESFQLTAEQQRAVERICAAIDRSNAAAAAAAQDSAAAATASSQLQDTQETFLLQGITGSGKTEVYLRAAAHAVDAGKQVLMLVPEIALTAQLVKRFQAWFGDQIAVAHSKLSRNERGDVWYRMRTRQAQVLIGVRSAVFAPFADLGLVIIDEEHETSYKQEERPNYHARAVALARCHNTGAPLVLGSATPDICTYYKALRGEYTHLRLTQRPNGSQLPQVHLVDMRKELQAKNYSVLSRQLQQALVTTVAEGEQAIVLLNRRGYSTFVMCRDCGYTITCPHCAVALVYHRAHEDMRCHYCGNTAPVPEECPNCHSRRIKFFGTGTQKAEAELAQLPDVRVLRMDQDSTLAKFAHEDILRQFASGASNVLIGTQMVAKGHDIPNVTLVGVLSADSALNLPDFRASERAFSLLTQAAGRAGRGARPGQVIFQTYDVENNIIQLAAKQDYDSFAKLELKARKEYFYPPFAQMLKLTIWDRSDGEGLALAQRLVFYLQQLQLEGKLSAGDKSDVLQISGPFPALVSKVRDMYRYNIVIKAKDLAPVKQAILNSEFKEQKNLYFDIDPVSVI
ncbi:MAG: primosomal protein N' [Phascolarctobacterium sp.]|nr:primosomal protein N' [Phascolarctobacterium sp.]